METLDPPLSVSVIESANFLFPSLVIRFCLPTDGAGEREREGDELPEREQNIQQKKLR